MIMPEVTFLPMNKKVDARSGQTLLDVALEYDIPLQHACGGYCACTTCHLLVESGPLSPMQDDELERLERVAIGNQENSRLGCQARVCDEPVTVRIFSDHSEV